MFLTSTAVFHYLRDRGLLLALDPEFEVVTAHRRNHNFLVRANGGGFAVKQVRYWSESQRANLKREADWYWFAAHDTRLAAMRHLLPSARSWDPRNSVLVLDLLPLTSMAGMDALFDCTRAKLVGEAMALVHRSMTWLPEAADLNERFPGEIPAFLDVASIVAMEPLKDDGTKSDSRKELLRVIRTHFGFGPALDRLRLTWRNETLVHGDWKLGNCLADNTDPQVQPRIVDWESPDIGDPVWDCSMLLQSYWTYWITDPATYELAMIRPAVQAFSNAYGLHNAARTRAVAFAGARLLQTAWEWLENEEQMTAPVVRLLQAAANILEDPAKAEGQLFSDR